MVNKVGGAGNKWTKETELDMLMAMMLDDDNFVKPNWAKVHSKMTEWGHLYSKSSIQQHWNMLHRAFKARRSEGPATPSTTLSSPMSTGSRKKQPNKKVADLFSPTPEARPSSSAAASRKNIISKRAAFKSSALVIEDDNESDSAAAHADIDSDVEFIERKPAKRAKIKQEKAGEKSEPAGETKFEVKQEEMETENSAPGRTWTAVNIPHMAEEEPEHAT